MAHVVPEKSNIAWFKLAELVARREKERALGIYRLLSHSLINQAYNTYLEAEVLAAFQDTKAPQLYMRAAVLYEEQGNRFLAVTLYKILLEHYGQENYLTKIRDLSEDNIVWWESCVHNLISAWCERGLYTQALHAVLSWSCPITLRLQLLEYIVKHAQKALDASAYEKFIAYCSSDHKDHRSHNILAMLSTLRSLSA